MRKDILSEEETRFYIAETVLGIEAIHLHRSVIGIVWTSLLSCKLLRCLTAMMLFSIFHCILLTYIIHVSLILVISTVISNPTICYWTERGMWSSQTLVCVSLWMCPRSRHSQREKNTQMQGNYIMVNELDEKQGFHDEKDDNSATTRLTMLGHCLCTLAHFRLSLRGHNKSNNPTGRRIEGNWWGAMRNSGVTIAFPW
jgi:hypothetical protein